MDRSGDLVIKQYYLGCLSQASYLIGDAGTGRAAVVDPQRDVSAYLDDARAAGLRIERVLETHVHADFLSGHLELAGATGAPISYGDAADVEFATEPLSDGQILSLGTVTLEILHTPGHTPESICILVRESPGAGPYGVLTGDTLFVGDVGRPDLLGANGWSPEKLARALFRSTRERLLPLPDATRVFPAHGAGSACGKNLSTETSSTIGEQRRTNYALAEMTEDAFVSAVCAGQSVAPMYFAHASYRNRCDHAVLDETTPVRALSADRVRDLRRDGAVVLDTRDPQDFAVAHLDGAVNVGLAGRFAETAGQVITGESDIVLVGAPGTEVEARNRLARIGFDRVAGHLDGGIGSVPARDLRSAARLDADRLESRTDPVQLLDVRAPAEVESTGLIAGAYVIPLAALVSRIDELDPTRPTVVYCAGGYRSSIAASALRARGFTDVSDLIGGFGAWDDGTRPMEHPLPA